MATDLTSNQPVQPENEIDLIEVVKKLWTKRKFIIKVTVIWACLGVLVALFSAKEFSADCTIVPQTGDKTAGGNLGGLAAMAGINFGVISEGDVLSPKIYPKILASVPFQKEIMQTEIKFEDYEHPVKLFDYFMNEDYQKFSLIGTAIKYTIGLPGLIISAIRGEEPEPEYGGGVASSLQILSKDESECMKVQMLLQQYVTDFKIEKVKANLDFVEGRYQEAKHQYEVKQEELALFEDANRNPSTSVARAAQARLTNEYTLLFGVYNELAKQREQAYIKVKETTPVFTVVEPVTIPAERSKPKRGLICIAFTFLGGFIGIGLVLILPFLAQVSGCKRLKGWLPEEKE